MPIGPRAWILPVDIPTSAPRPMRNPSAKRVEALIITSAESTRRTNSPARASSSVTIQSVWCEPWALMKSIASSSPPTALTDTVRSPYSESQSSSVAGAAPSPPSTPMHSASALTSTPFSLNISAILGRNPRRTDLSTKRFSMALQAAGYWILESSATA